MAASTGARLQRKAARTAVSAAAAPSFRRCYGPEFVAKAVREWIAAVGASTAYIMPGSPWENGYCESFNSKLPRRAAFCSWGFGVKLQGRTPLIRSKHPSGVMLLFAVGICAPQDGGRR